MSEASDKALVASALSFLASMGKPVEVDQSTADHMGLHPDLAMPDDDEISSEMFRLAA